MPKVSMYRLFRNFEAQSLKTAEVIIRQACRMGSRSPSGERKVRSPKGSVPANGRGDSLKANFTESATENIPPGNG